MNPFAPRPKSRASALKLCLERGFTAGDVLRSKTWRTTRTLVRIGNGGIIVLQEKRAGRTRTLNVEDFPIDVARSEAVDAQRKVS